MSEGPQAIEQEVSSERLALKPVDNLFVLVHPSFLINNTEYPSSKTYGPGYIEQTQNVQANAQKRFTPKSENDVLLFIPSSKPNLEDWRKNRAGKKEDPDRKDWTDLYTVIKRGSEFPDNVIITGDLSYNLSFNDDENQVKEDAEHKVIQKLDEKGFQIDPNTTITVAGEFLDMCVSKTIDKLFLLPQVTKVKIPKDTSFVSAYGVEAVVSNGKTAVIDTGLRVFKDMYKKSFQFSEDEEYFYIAQPQKP